MPTALSFPAPPLYPTSLKHCCKTKLQHIQAHIQAPIQVWYDIPAAIQPHIQENIPVWEHIQVHIRVVDHIQALIQVWEHIQVLVCALFCLGTLYAPYPAVCAPGFFIYQIAN